MMETHDTAARAGSPLERASVPAAMERGPGRARADVPGDGDEAGRDREEARAHPVRRHADPAQRAKRPEALRTMTDHNAGVIEEFRANKGRVGGYFEAATVLLLHAVGRK